MKLLMKEKKVACPPARWRKAEKDKIITI